MLHRKSVRIYICYRFITYCYSTVKSKCKWKVDSWGCSVKPTLRDFLKLLQIEMKNWKGFSVERKWGISSYVGDDFVSLILNFEIWFHSLPLQWVSVTFHILGLSYTVKTFCSKWNVTPLLHEFGGSVGICSFLLSPLSP